MKQMTKKLGFLAILIIALVCLTALPISATITLDTKNNTRSVSDTTKITVQTSGSVKPAMFQDFIPGGSDNTSQDSGQVTMNYHLDDERSAVHYQNLPFNPSIGFHRYGFLWQPNRLDWAVDGQIVYSFIDPGVASKPGYIMINSWTGNVNWGGNPPRQDAVTVYDWIKYYPNVTSIPDGGTE
jgi:beta-glucanase (GH16 family)